jgi:hypothetical protein
MLPLGLRHFLLSAYSARRKNAFVATPTRKAVAEAGGHWFVDSGMISALRDKVPDWSERQDEVLAVAKRIDAELVAHLDIPMEPHLLRNIGWTRRQALETTIRNARAFLDADLPASKKVYVIQGWDRDLYEECIRRYEDLGIPDGGSLGVGTLCMRKPTRGLWPLLEYVRRETEGRWLHSFGTGDPAKLKRLAGIGIDSVDEGNTVGAIANGNPKRAARLAEAYGDYDA